MLASRVACGMANEDTAQRTSIATEYSAIPVQRLLTGEKRSSGALFEGVTDTNTKQLLVENNTSDRVLLLFEPTVRSSGQSYVRKIKNPSVDTVGDAATLVNPKTDDATPLSVTVTTAGDGETGAISGGTNYPQLTSGSGSNPNNASPGESGQSNITDAIAPGDSLAVEAINQSGAVSDISITAEFIAFPESEIERLPF